MKSIRLFLIGLCSLGFISSSYGFLREYIPRLEPDQQAILAEVIVEGRIVEIEDIDAEVTTYQGATQKTAYKIANIRIKEALVGAKGLTHIRVGFIPNNQPSDPRLKAFEELEWGYRHDTYGINEEGCFFLQKHPEGNFYVPLHNGNRLDSKHLSYEGELGKIKRMVHAFEKPMEALLAKNSDDRQFAASALIKKYRTAPTSNQVVVKEVEIPKEESKWILEALGEIENDPNQLTTFMNLFCLLRLTERDGWIPPKSNDQAEINKFIKDSFGKWYKTYGEQYRLKKFVISKK